MYFLLLFKDASYAKRIKHAKRRDALKGRSLQRTRRVPGLIYFWKWGWATLCLYHGNLTLRAHGGYNLEVASKLGFLGVLLGQMTIFSFIRPVTLALAPDFDPLPVCNFCIEQYMSCLAPKVLLVYLRSMITIPSNPSHPSTKPL